MTPLRAALALATVLFGLAFRGPRAAFWDRMTVTGLALGGLALASDPELRRLRFRARDVLLGLLSAAGLYVLFRAGDRFARAFVPGGGRQIGEIYALRTVRPAAEIGTRLATVIGPAEELFWRGFVQRRAGYVPATLAYGGVHLASANFTLIGAASIAGGYWGLLRALGLSMEALIVSHIAWDIWIFLVAPTSPVAVAAPTPGERGPA